MMIIMVLHIDGQAPSLCLKKVMEAAYAQSHLCFQTYFHDDDDYYHDDDDGGDDYYYVDDAEDSTAHNAYCDGSIYFSHVAKKKLPLELIGKTRPSKR